MNFSPSIPSSDSKFSNRSNWQVVAVRIVQGHRVASGQNGNPLFPGGTLRMQAPFFQALGLDLGPGDVAVSPVSPGAGDNARARAIWP